jgi:nicotinate-nucleotide adenylyltransferase
MIERIGIMGGMFDPVHIGHIRVAVAAQQALRLDQVRLIPCGIPNHRDQALCSSLQRLDMLRLAVADDSSLVVDDRELNRQGTSYTYDTLLSLRQEFQQAGLYFILGIDAFATLDRWHRWRELFELCHFVVIERPGYHGTLSDNLQVQIRRRRVRNVSELFDKKYGSILELEGLDSPVSSSMVRDHIARNDSLDQLLDPAVAGYLNKHQLYRKAVDNHRELNGQ